MSVFMMTVVRRVVILASPMGITYGEGISSVKVGAPCQFVVCFGGSPLHAAEPSWYAARPGNTTPDCTLRLCCAPSASGWCEVVLLRWEMVMGNDLLRSFNGTQDVRVETQTCPQGACLKECLGLPTVQQVVQQLYRRNFAVLFAIFPDHALS